MKVSKKSKKPFKGKSTKKVKAKRKVVSTNQRGTLDERKVKLIKIGIKKGKKQSVIAKAMGVSQALISQIKNGHVWQDVRI